MSKALAYECPTTGLAGLHWQSSRSDKNSDQLNLALHGWLDNAESFRPLAERLIAQSSELLAIDLPGHGQSPWKAEDADYYIWSYTKDLHALISHAKASSPNLKVNLIGHSMGGAGALFFAAAFPELVNSLVLIDSIGPLVTPEDKVAGQLRSSILKHQDLKPARTFESVDVAIAARSKASPSIEKPALEALVKRNLRTISAGYTWSWDPKLRSDSQVRMTEGQVAGFCSALTCPVLALVAEPGLIPRELFEQRVSYIKSDLIEVHKLDGHHHFHMDAKTSQVVADLIQEFHSKC